MRSSLLAATMMVGMIGAAWAKPERCVVRVIKDAPAKESPDSIIRKGSTDEIHVITGVNVDKKTGQMFFCGHGSFCYPAAAFEFASPCSITPLNYGTPDADEYEFEPK